MGRPTGKGVWETMTLGDDVKTLALALGFAAAGIAPAEPLREHEEHLRQRMVAGGLSVFPYFTAERAGIAADPGALLPGARSVIMLVTPSLLSSSAETHTGPQGSVARYAHGRDYHLVARERLGRLIDYLRERVPGANCRAFVDATPLLERAFAARAGLGWFGKHNCLVTPDWGSWVTLAEVVTDVPLEPDTPLPNGCGDCRACLAACPTGALVGPFAHRADLCLSYLTTELRGAIPRNLRPALSARVLGCDSCQTACPRNAALEHPLPLGEGWDEGPRTLLAQQALTPTPSLWEGEKMARPLGGTLPLVDLLGLDEPAFAARFAGTAAMRAKRRGLLRNAAVALGNLGDRDAVPALTAALADPEPLVRGHAAWALGRLGGRQAREALAAAGRSEENTAVGEEVSLAMAEVP